MATPRRQAHLHKELLSIRIDSRCPLPHEGEIRVFVKSEAVNVGVLRRIELPTTGCGHRKEA